MKSKFTVVTIFLVVSLLTSCQKEPNVSIQIDCGEQNSEETFLTVNGREVGQCPLDIKVVAGEINIQAQRDYENTSYRHIEKSITLAENTTKKISLDMSNLELPESYWYQRVADIQTANEYIENNPKGSSLTRVKKMFTEFTETKSWKQTKGNLKRLQQYVKDYPKGRYIKQANIDIDEISVNYKKTTIIDEKHNLMWMRCSLGQRWNKGTGHCDEKAHRYTYNQAMSKVKKFSYAGYNNWRLPTVKELESIVYCSIGKPKSDSSGRLRDCPRGSINPTIDQRKFPNTPKSFFWSASPYVGNSNYAWYVNFRYGNSGHDGPNDRSSDPYVRLVRSMQ